MAYPAKAIATMGRPAKTITYFLVRQLRRSCRACRDSERVGWRSGRGPRESSRCELDEVMDSS
jgi:hypothetical protein